MAPQFLPKKYREYIGLGAEIAATIVLPISLGYFLDSWMGWSPWGLLTGALIGIIFFFLLVFRIARKLNEN